MNTIVPGMQMSVDPFDQAMRETWQMVDPTHPAGEPGSYYRGEHNGICAALKTLRENYERIRAAVHKSEPFTKVSDADVDAEIRRSGCLRTDGNRAVVRSQLETAHGVPGRVNDQGEKA